MAIEIETSPEKYYEPLTKLADDYQKELVAMDPDHRLKWEPGFGKDWLDRYLEEIRTGDGQFLVAHEGKTPVGFIIGTIDHSDSGPSDRAHIAELFVDLNYRGQGVASMLMRQMEDYFQSKGVKDIWTSVLSFNPTAQELYKKLGYKPRDISFLKTQ